MATADSIVGSLHPLPPGAMPIPDFPDYAITADGIVLSRKVYGSKVGRIGPWWVMKAKTASPGYLYVNLYRQRQNPERRLIHWLVLEVFVGPRPEGQVGRHLDDNRTNNVLENLAWGSYSDNCQDAAQNGRIKYGEARHHSKLTNAQVREIRQLAADGMPRNDIEARFGLRKQLVCKIILRQLYRCVD